MKDNEASKYILEDLCSVLSATSLTRNEIVDSLEHHAKLNSMVISRREIKHIVRTYFMNNKT